MREGLQISVLEEHTRGTFPTSIREGRLWLVTVNRWHGETGLALICCLQLRYPPARKGGKTRRLGFLSLSKAPTGPLSGRKSAHCHSSSPIMMSYGTIMLFCIQNVLCSTYGESPPGKACSPCAAPILPLELGFVHTSFHPLLPSTQHSCNARPVASRRPSLCHPSQRAFSSPEA